MLKYHAEHCWARPEGQGAVVGVSRFAVENLNEVIYIDLPMVGDELVRGQAYGEVESTKTTSDLIAPVSGKVVEVNSGLEDDLAPLNTDSENSGWLCKLEAVDPAEMEELMDKAAYDQLAAAGE